jgi:hypothetical protein
MPDIRKWKGFGSVLGPKGLGRLDRPSRARLGFAVSSTCGSASRLDSWAGWARRPARPNRPAHGSLPSLSLTIRAQGATPRACPDRWGPLVSLSTDLVWRPDPMRMWPVRSCVRDQVCVWVVCAQDVFDGRPHWLGRDANAMSRPCRMVIAHGEAVAGSWRVTVGAQCGLTEARRGGGTGRPRGAGVHACTRVLASQGRGVAVPCAGHRHPGPAARRGG